ncbi:MAG: hypothetical protein AAB778_01375 [Patescibacteria group bacterium]
MGTKTILIILLGSLIWSLTMIRSGLNYSYGVGFWGANGHDGVWHLALSESLSAGSFENPIFAGEALKNYHFGFDLMLALINQVTKIPINYLYFQILPPIFALLIGYLVFSFVLNWRGSRTEAIWATAFVYFSGGFGFLITFLRDRVFTGESMFWSQQAASTLINPPFAMSLIFILLGLIPLQKKNLFLSILFFGLLIQIKVYAGLLVLGGLFCASLFELFSKRYSLITKIFLGTLIFSLVIFLPFNKNPQSMIVWQPFWFLETMMSYSDRLGWERFYSAMTTYKMGHIWIKGILAYTTAFIIFVIGNMGLRVIGFYAIKRVKIDSLLVFIVSICLAGVIIPMFFVQSGTPWNTIQFFFYYLFFFAIFAGIVMSQIKSRFKYIIFVIFAIFSSWSTLQHYLPKMPQAIISNDEIEALNFLSRQPQGIVLTYPFDSDKAKAANSNPPRPLYFYDSTAYVAAYSGKQVFLEDEVNLNIMGYDWKSRRNEVLQFISNLDPLKGKEFLDKNNIKYLYLVKENSPLQGELLRLGSADLGLEEIFENKVSILYRYGENFGGN